jgi:hypothetical protein
MSPVVRRIAALALPLVVLCAMIVRAEVIIASGRHYVLDIEGYDPRDLLRGQYLRFRVKWNGPREVCSAGDPECCLCILPDAEPDNPQVRATTPGNTDDCQAFITAASLENLQQYFIPEGRGGALERAIRDRRATIRVSVSRGGDVIIEDLLLDGEPWTDVMGRAPASD